MKSSGVVAVLALTAVLSSRAAAQVGIRIPRARLADSGAVFPLPAAAGHVPTFGPRPPLNWTTSVQFHGLPPESRDLRCPMPVLKPDSAKQDRMPIVRPDTFGVECMPTAKSDCVNPLGKQANPR